MNQARILAIIVLHEMRPQDSCAFRTLRAAYGNIHGAGVRLRILIFDNTPTSEAFAQESSDVEYLASPTNVGLASAYNHALRQTDGDKSAWLLLLDQDTSLPLDFVSSLSEQISRYERDKGVAAIVPIVCSNGVVVSPKRVGFTSLGALPRESHGVQEIEITAINSGTAIRCDFIRSIGGFNNAYWLDYLDHWLFRQIYAHGKRAALSQSCLGHQLSVQDYRRNVSMKRYSSILKGEAAFMTTHKLKVQLPFYLLRLTARTVKLTIQGQSDKASLTLQTIMKILRHPMRSLEEHPL